ncbi:MAG: hypothetical protein EXR51_04320 [Dehalococcoidia bacterium]|nr:hypothetical protein [Dehalococcoidia bacterium]
MTGEQTAEALAFIAGARWTFAKTMPWAPHEYTVRNWGPTEPFAAFVHLIRSAGYPRQWKQYLHTYMDVDGWTYWTMGAPVEQTVIINRKTEGTQW